MALAQVLSAVRELILDPDDFPAAEADRLRVLAERYPALSQIEREDLAKIPAEKLDIYTVSIFVGERNVLRAKFPITFQLLDRAHDKLGRTFDSIAFVREMHARKPWRSAKVNDLVTNFAAFITEQHRDLILAQPGLDGVITVEAASFEITRAVEEEFSAKQSIKLVEEPDRSVSELLALEAFMPGYVSAHEFSYQAPALYRDYHERGELPDTAVPVIGKARSIASRTSDYEVAWTDPSAEMFAVLTALPRAKFISVADLAENFLSRAAAGLSEQDAAVLFFRDLTFLNSAGAVLLREP